MASRPKGVSKREEAAAAKGAKLNYKTGALVKPAVKPAVRKSVSPLVGAGPLMTGQSRVSSQGPAIGPLLENQSRPFDYSTAKSQLNSGKSSSTRSMASKASKGLSVLSGLNAIKSGSSKPAGIPLGGGTDTSAMSKILSTPARRGSGSNELPGGGSENMFSRLFSALSGAQAKKAQNDIMRGDPGAYNTPAQLAENRQEMQSRINYGLGVPGAMASNGDFNDFGNLQSGDTPYDDGGFHPQSRPGDMDQATALDNVFLRGATPSNPYSTTDINPEDAPQTTSQYEEQIASGFDRNTQKEGIRQSDRFKRENPGQQIPGKQIPEIDFQQQQNELYGGGSGPVDIGGATIGNRSGRGSGMFGTGKGMQSEDPYIKELRKAYASNGGEKWLRRQFEELIAALDPTYAALQKEGTDALNQQLNQENVKLASVMNANNTGDSEQRAQLMAGQQAQTQTALGNLLAKLALQKSQDVSGYRSKLNEALASNADKRQYKNQQTTGVKRGETAPTMGGGKLSRKDIFNWTEDALNKGYSWQEIADNAKEQGIGTETGGYLDQLLNQANKQGRYR